MRRTDPSPDRQKAEGWGRWAEALAALYLLCKGYRILARRFRSRLGEVDLVVRRGKVLAFVEVKARANAKLGLEAVGERQRRRIEQGAQLYLAAHPAAADLEIRFDLIVVPRTIRVIHLKGAWRPQ